MRYILLVSLLSFYGFVYSQSTKAPSSSAPKPAELKSNMTKVKFTNSQDEFMFNITFDNMLVGGNDSGYKSNFFNPNLGIYFLYDIPFGKSGISFAPGLGFTFSKTNLDNSILNQDTLGTAFIQSKNHDWFTTTAKTYDGSSFYTSWIEAPIELRWRSKPVNGRSSIKVAVGFRVGLRLAANSKINYIDNLEKRELTNIEKPYSDLNAFRYGTTLRIGYGAINLFGYMGLNQFIKDSKNHSGQDLRQYSVGISITGM